MCTYRLVFAFELTLLFFFSRTKGTTRLSPSMSYESQQQCLNDVNVMLADQAQHGVHASALLFYVGLGPEFSIFFCTCVDTFSVSSHPNHHF